PGIFDAFWAYGHEHLMLRTRNRVEMDFMENTGKDQAFVDANLHIHKGQFPFRTDPTVITAGVKERIGARVLDKSHNFPVSFNMFDGEWHEIVVKIEDDLTYIYAGVDGVLYETARCQTIPEWSMMKYIIVDRSNSRDHGDRDLMTTEVIDYVVDYVEILEK